MTSKFFRRTFRNLIFRKRPYFAHLALTHRCNLRCRFCHVTERRFEELDTAGMKRVVEALDRTGVAVVSISGGGEPLLRDDFDEIIDYAAGKGLYVKLTSNGTMARAKYERLLRSRVDEIGISLDGVKGHDLPFSHVGSPILATLRYLNDHLPAGKRLTVNATISETNREEVEEILAYCEEHYPKARVWLNPVVVGEGALRTNGARKCRPDYLTTAKSETRLRAEFYNSGAEQQYREERFDWGCLAGDLFFDVKPNGDYWLCQDQPSATPLNVLEPEFAAKRAMVSKEQRRRCEGCLYSCYYLVQKCFEPRNWRDIGRMWWQVNTAPGGQEREAAKRYGPWGAVACLLWRGAFGWAAQPAPRAVALLMLAAGLSNGQAAARVENQYTAPGAKRWEIVEAEGPGPIMPLLKAEEESGRPGVDAETYGVRRRWGGTGGTAVVPGEAAGVLGRSTLEFDYGGWRVGKEAASAGAVERGAEVALRLVA